MANRVNYRRREIVQTTKDNEFEEYMRIRPQADEAYEVMDGELIRLPTDRTNSRTRRTNR